VRITQGKEPAHFVRIWRGNMVVYSGGVASGFRTIQEADAEPARADGSADAASADRVFHVKGCTACPPYAVEAPVASSSLNSGKLSPCSLLHVSMTGDLEYNQNNAYSARRWLEYIQLKRAMHKYGV
jgi:hypothetical protein